MTLFADSAGLKEYSLVRSGKVRHVCLVQLAFAQEIVDSPMISVVRMQVQPNIDQ